MKLYKVIQSVNLDSDVTVNKHSILETSIKLYMKLKKEFKSHRNVLNRNISDVHEIYNYNDVIDDAIHNSGIKTEEESELIGVLVKKMSCM